MSTHIPLIIDTRWSSRVRDAPDRSSRARIAASTRGPTNALIVFMGATIRSPDNSNKAQKVPMRIRRDRTACACSNASAKAVMALSLWSAVAIPKSEPRVIDIVYFRKRACSTSERPCRQRSGRDNQGMDRPERQKPRIPWAGLPIAGRDVHRERTKSASRRYSVAPWQTLQRTVLSECGTVRRSGCQPTRRAPSLMLLSLLSTARRLTQRCHSRRGIPLVRGICPPFERCWETAGTSGSHERALGRG